VSRAHVVQNVHSNEQIIALVALGARSRPQHSQFGRSSSIVGLGYDNVTLTFTAPARS
jgi:hypothetical protein